MTSEPQTAKALLLPANGSKIRIMDYVTREEDEGDVVASRMADFYDRVPSPYQLGGRVNVSGWVPDR